MRISRWRRKIQSCSPLSRIGFSLMRTCDAIWGENLLIYVISVPWKSNHTVSPTLTNISVTFTDVLSNSHKYANMIIALTWNKPVSLVCMISGSQLFSPSWACTLPPLDRCGSGAAARSWRPVSGRDVPPGESPWREEWVYGWRTACTTSHPSPEHKSRNERGWTDFSGRLSKRRFLLCLSSPGPWAASPCSISTAERLQPACPDQHGGSARSCTDSLCSLWPTDHLCRPHHCIKNIRHKT